MKIDVGQEYLKNFLRAEILRNAYKLLSFSDVSGIFVIFLALSRLNWLIIWFYLETGAFGTLYFLS